MSTDVAPPTGKRGLRGWLGELSTAVKTAGGIAGSIAAILGVVFLLWPNIKPGPDPAEGSADFTKPTLERPVTFGQYLDRVDLTRDPYSQADLAREGVLAGFGLTIKGYKGKDLPLRWFVLDTGTHEIVDQQNKKLLLHPDRDTARLTRSVWIAKPQGGGPFKIVFELYPPGAKAGQPGVASLATAETDTFPA